MTEELLARVVLSAVMLGTGSLLWWMARAAASGRLKRNAYAGIRTGSGRKDRTGPADPRRISSHPTFTAVGV